MLPKSNDVNIYKVYDSKATKTYFLDFKNKRICGYVNDKKAMEQSIMKVLDTKRYAFEIYDWNYGSQLNELIGKNSVIVEMLAEKYINDALLADSRIEKIKNFEMEKDMNEVSIKFDAITNIGTININMEVNI